MKTVKFKEVNFSNKKKQIKFIYFSQKSIAIHYGSLGINKNIKKVWIDKKTRGKSVGIEFADQTIDYLPYDQPLHIARYPDYMLQNHIENVIAQIKEELARKKISKKYLAYHLQTSDNQIQRLLNPNILNKNLSQLYKIASILSLEFEIKVNAA